MSGEWTEHMDADLRRLRAERFPIVAIAKFFGKNRDQIRRRMTDLGLAAFNDTPPIAHVQVYRPGIDPRPKFEL